MSIQQDDWGTVLKIKLKDDSNILDVSGATNIEVVFARPSGGTTTKDASFVTDGTDGWIQYIIEEGILNTAGLWKIQVILTFANGKWRTNVGTFDVVDIL